MIGIEINPKLKEEVRKPRVLWISDNPFTNTGYSSQSLFTMNGLADNGWDCHYLAHNYIGQKLDQGNVKLNDGTEFKFTLYPNGREAFGKDVIMPMIRELRPDVVVYLMDTFMVYPWIMDIDFAPARSVFWFPSDGGRFPQGCENVLKKFTLPIAMAKFGQKQVHDYYGLQSHYIPHAVDVHKFKPLSKEDKEKARLKWGLQGKFVVGLMGRNQSRKMHDRAFKMFNIFCKDKPDAVLLCHMDPDDPASPFDIKRLIIEYNLHNRVIFTGTKYYKGFTYEEMVEVYNMMDVYLSSSSGEGFGVGTIEAMSCEIPCVLPNYTTTEELVIDNDAGLGINMVGCEDNEYFKTNSSIYDMAMDNGTVTGSWGVERGLVDVVDGANKLSIIYANLDNCRDRMAKNGRRAAKESYSWEVIKESWDKVLKELIQ